MLTPANAAEPMKTEVPTVLKPAVQTISFTSAAVPTLERDGVSVKKLPEAEPAPVSTPETTSTSSTTTKAEAQEVPTSDNKLISDFISAAVAQLGDTQDCTALVERALRAVSYSVGDLGPMGFVKYGTVVSPEDAQPGDIMMREGHVAIYMGKGVTLNGGVLPNWTTKYLSGSDGSPFSYTTIVRLG